MAKLKVGQKVKQQFIVTTRFVAQEGSTLLTKDGIFNVIKGTEKLAEDISVKVVRVRDAK